MKHGQLIPEKNVENGLHNAFVGMGNMIIVEPDKNTIDYFIKLISRAYEYGHPECSSAFDEQKFNRNFSKVKYADSLYSSTI